MAKNLDKLKTIVKREMNDCIGLPDGQLSSDRAMLKNAYLGAGYTIDAQRAQNGWSTYVDRTVLETVEWAKGPLLKVFAGTGDLVRFEPGNQSQQQAAQDATDYVNKVVFGQNAFDLVYGPITDGLYQRVGWCKVYFDDSIEAEVIQELEDLTPEQAEAFIISQPPPQPDISTESDIVVNKKTGLYNIKITQQKRKNTVKVEPIPSERVIYSKDALSIEKARFVAHWEDRMVGELIAEGYPKDLIMSISSDDDDDYPESRAQRSINAEDIDDTRDVKDGSKIIRIYESYFSADIKNTGELIKLKVIYANSGKDNITILNVEEWTMYRPPLFAACSLPLTYSPVGLSLADLVVDLQALRTEMQRDLNDNMYLANHGEVVLKRQPGSDVDMDQFMARRPGGVYEVTGDVDVMPLPIGNIASLAIPGLELTDKAKEQRTGIGMSNQGLSADVLQNTATGAVILEESQNIRIEMIARIYAETFYKPMARYVLALARKYIQKPIIMQRRGQFNEINPSAWPDDMSVTVSVGLGTGSRQKQAQAIQQVMTVQEKISGALGKACPFGIPEVIKAAYKLAECLGLESPEQYFGTIEQAQEAQKQMMEQQPKPDPDMMKAQAQVQKTQADIQLSREKAQAQAQAQVQKMQLDAMLEEQKIRSEAGLSLQEMNIEKELDVQRMLIEGTKAPGATEIQGRGTL